MPQLLIELFSEEIPARMQAKAEADLLKAVTGALGAAGLSHESEIAFSGPRRLGLVLEGLTARSEDVREERKGPKLGAPDKAIEGFLRGAGLESIDQAEVRTDPKKGEFYVAVIEKPGRAAADIIAEAMPEIIRGFHWPKSMRTGHGELRWVRPLQRIVCVLDGAIVPFEVDGIASGNETEGHRVHGRGPYKVTGWTDYKDQLEGDGHVRLSREDRRKLIAEGAAKVCKSKKLELVEDAGLLEEVVGLAEWPVVVLGDMDPAFLELPPEVIRLSMRTHQKYFAVRDPKTGDLAPHFVVVANIEATDKGKKIAAGNAKVLSARLEDARFFWANDVGRGLEDMGGDLARIAFKEELGSMADKVERVAALARELAPKVGADPDAAEKAARLAKADLVSDMVYEFPELQGVMGRYYALQAGATPEIANAIADHYKPQGPADAVPTAPVSIAVALADKLDTLVGFWAIDEKPTGSKDPFALRRAALGVVRIVLENEVRLGLETEISDAMFVNLVHTPLSAHGDINLLEATDLIEDAFEQFLRFKRVGVFGFLLNSLCQYDEIVEGGLDKLIDLDRRGDNPLKMVRWVQETQAIIADEIPEAEVAEHWGEQYIGCKDKVLELSGGFRSDLLTFFADRLKQVLRDEGKRHDLIDAVFALGEDDLVLITKRVEALTGFLASEDGENLLAGYKRAANILKAEEKKDGRDYHGDPNPDLFTEAAERDLHSAITSARAETERALGDEDFEAAMLALAKLRAPVDAFFDGVMVNADDAAVRENRLLILAAIRDALHGVADFSKIEG